MAIKLVNDKAKCSGCSACMNICPVNVINMAEDEDGFLYPSISSAACIECGQCTGVCPFENELCPESLQVTYVAIAENVDLSESSSGAIVPSIAANFIDAGGIVYGCAMQYEEQSITIKHVRISDYNELIRIKGSKYVQSDIGLIYRLIRKDLNDELKVLFSGTPCQVAGLYGYLKKDYPNLYTIDIVCHGVPSQKFFHSYIEYEESLRNIKIHNFVFRDKSQGWKLYGRMDGTNSEGKQEKKYFNAEDSSYYQLFLNKYIYRDSCYHCPYASKHRPGNLTAADYWNIDLIHPELVKENGGPIDIEKGVSALVVNNKKGEKLMEAFGKNIQKFPSSYENASRYNYQFVQPSNLPEGRRQLFDEFKNGYEIIDKKYKSQLRVKKLKRKIRAAVPKWLKNSLKSIRRIRLHSV